jgi:hypothetical protein
MQNIIHFPSTGRSRSHWIVTDTCELPGREEVMNQRTRFYLTTLTEPRHYSLSRQGRNIGVRLQLTATTEARCMQRGRRGLHGLAASALVKPQPGRIFTQRYHQQVLAEALRGTS